jgi:hypothetical protein
METHFARTRLSAEGRGGRAVIEHREQLTGASLTKDSEKERKGKRKFSDTFWRTSAMNSRVVKIAARTRKRKKNGERFEGVRVEGAGTRMGKGHKGPQDSA